MSDYSYLNGLTGNVQEQIDDLGAPTTPKIVSTTPYQMLPDDRIVRCTVESGTVILPPGGTVIPGDIYYIGNGANPNVTINPATDESINDSISTQFLTNPYNENAYYWDNVSLSWYNAIRSSGVGTNLQSVGNIFSVIDSPEFAGIVTAPTIRLTSPTAPLILGFGTSHPITFDTTFNIGESLVKFPDGETQTIKPVGISLGTAVSHIDIDGAQNKIVIINQALAGTFIPTNAEIIEDDTIKQAFQKAQGQLNTKEPYDSDGNSPDSLVIRDEFGELQANFANSTDLATNIIVAPDASSTLTYPLFVSNVGPAQESAKTNNDFNYNAVTNTLTVSINAAAITSSNIAVPNTLTLGYGGSLLTVDSVGKIIASDFINNLNGYKLSWASATTIGLSAGTCSIYGTGLMMSQAGNVVINIANVGVVNGLDAGSAANNTNYYVYAIFHTNPALNGGILSTNSTVPTLPSGYIASRYVGKVRYATAAFIKFVQTGNSTTRKITYTDSASITQSLSGGSSNVYAAVSLSSFVSLRSTSGVIRYDFDSAASAASFISVRETGSTVSTGLTSFCAGAASNSGKGLLPFICNSSQSIDYLLSVAGSACNLYVLSYEEEL